jgi:GTP-binding protein
MKPIIAIVGKPNVGKSTLFNRMVGRNVAITSDIAGTTRDRIYQSCDLDKLEVTLVDTGGLQYGKKENIEEDIYSQALLGIQEANMIMFVIDGSLPPTIEDEHAIRTIMKAKKPYICVANKTDRKSHEHQISEYYRFGIKDIVEVSASHGNGVDEMMSTLEKELRKIGFKKEPKRVVDKNVISIAILGRPNVGKSSLVNALIGQKKMIVSDMAGTTRDTVDTELEWEGNKFLLKDTAGIRKKGKIGREIEFWSVLRGIKALEESDIAVLLIDATEGIVSQDAHIAGYIKDEKKGLVVVLNKIDLVTVEQREELMHDIQHDLEFLPWSPIIMTSALHAKNVQKIFELALEIKKEREKEINPEELKTIIQEIIQHHAPPRSHGQEIKIFSIDYTKKNPPTFIITVSDTKIFHFSYKRYLERMIRERYGFAGTGIDMKFVEKTYGKPRKSHEQRIQERKERRKK